MAFSSISFLFLFMPAVILLAYVVPAKLKNLVLVLTGLLFYSWGSPKNLIFLLFSVLFNYLTGIQLERFRQLNRPRRMKLLGLAAAAADILVLALFKYYVHVLPLGISFYTFTVLSYVFDVLSGRTGSETDPISFLLYVTFFPKVISGPIVQYADMKTELSERTMNTEKLSEGFHLFLIGLFKKVLLADTLGKAFSMIYGQELTILGSWLGMLFYSLQLYFDFSGYSDMAIGLAKMLGFDFAKNFDHPYMSKNIGEFWRRWHISLGNWFKQYVYFPMGGSRVGPTRLFLNLLTVWILTGIWHGNTLNYVFWGLFHGFFVILEKFVIKNKFDGIPAPARMILTSLIAGIGWIFFFTSTPFEALSWFGSMFGIGAAGFADKNILFVLLGNLILLVAAIIGSTDLPAKLYNRAFYENHYKKNETVLTVAAVALDAILLLSAIAGMLSSTYSSFLYFAF